MSSLPGTSGAGLPDLAVRIFVRHSGVCGWEFEGIFYKMVKIVIFSVYYIIKTIKITNE